MKVLVSGASGNLGGKLVSHLAQQDWCDKVFCADLMPPESANHRLPKAVQIDADFANWMDRRWREPLESCDAVVHLASRNPLPDCSWSEAADSLSMTAALVSAAAQAAVRRFVFASSNHVMGGYKDPPLSRAISPGALTTELLPAPGTSRIRGNARVRPVAYAASKLFGERIVLAQADASGGKLTSVCVRIGWCQRGENDPATISPGGTLNDKTQRNAIAPSEREEVAWFRGMWLSNRDFCELMERAIVADATKWKSPGIVVNGMSANTGMVWDLEASRRNLGYAPIDDVAVELASC